MENCLKTQLKGTISGGSFPILNCITVHAKIDSSTIEGKRSIRFSNEVESTEISVVGGGAYLSRNNDFSNPTNIITFAKQAVGFSTRVYLLPGEYDVTFKSKYSVTLVSPDNGDVATIGPVTSSTNQFCFCTNLTALLFQYSLLAGDVKELNTCTNLVNLRFDGNTALFGNIASLSPLTKLNYLGLYGVSNIEGQIEGLCSAMAANRAANDTLTVNLRGTKATYKGVVPRTTLTVTFNGAGGYSIA